jgi:hypothetical protein
MALDAWHPVADAGIMDNQEIAWPSTLLVCKVGVSSRFFVQRVYDAFSRYSNAWPAGDRRIETELKRSIRQRAGVHQLAACCCPSRSVHMRLTLRACHRFLITLEHQLWILRCWDCAARPTTTSALLRGHCSNHLFCLRQGRQRDQRGSHDEGVHHVGNLYFCRSVHFTIASTLGPFFHLAYSPWQLHLCETTTMRAASTCISQQSQPWHVCKDMVLDTLHEAACLFVCFVRPLR